MCVCVLSGVIRPNFIYFQFNLASLARKAPYGFSRLNLTQIVFLFNNYRISFFVNTNFKKIILGQINVVVIVSLYVYVTCVFDISRCLCVFQFF